MTLQPTTRKFTTAYKNTQRQNRPIRPGFRAPSTRLTLATEESETHYTQRTPVTSRGFPGATEHTVVVLFDSYPQGSPPSRTGHYLRSRNRESPHTNRITARPTVHTPIPTNNSVHRPTPPTSTPNLDSLTHYFLPISLPPLKNPVDSSSIT